MSPPAHPDKANVTARSPVGCNCKHAPKLPSRDEQVQDQHANNGFNRYSLPSDSGSFIMNRTGYPSGVHLVQKTCLGSYELQRLKENIKLVACWGWKKLCSKSL